MKPAYTAETVHLPKVSLMGSFPLKPNCGAVLTFLAGAPVASRHFFLNHLRPDAFPKVESLET
jgi:hypothetical protein